MKKIKSAIAILLIAVILSASLSVMAFADVPEIDNLKWNDDLSVEFSHKDAVKYSYSIYLNNSMIWGFGSTVATVVTRESMLPYMMELATYAVDNKGMSGTVSFDFVIYAYNASNESIARSVVSKNFDIEAVAEGKLSPDSEKWILLPESTSDKTKLTKAFHDAYDPDKAKITASLASSGLSYDQYINMLIGEAAKTEYYTFTGTLAQTMRFCRVYNSYGYGRLRIVKEEETKEISTVNITITLPASGQSLSDYVKGNNIKSETKGVKVKLAFNPVGIFEDNTRTYQTKFYGTNTYDITFMISFEKGYTPAKNITVNVNGQKINVNFDTMDTIDGETGYVGYYIAQVPGTLFNRIATFFHNLLMKIKYPNGMYM